MRRFITILLAILIGNIAIAQQKITITGQVKDVKNKALAYADILLTTADEKEHILAFSITDSRGKFSLEYSTEVPQMKVKVSSMGFKKKTQVLKVDPDKQIYSFTFVMDERMETLQEVEIRAKPKVRINKDTTVFNLENIVNGSEQVVEDILKKLPGMELQANGTYKFKGKDVQKVLLDGDDLFNRAYTIGTKNIKSQSIQGVEAIENYTENPLMQGVEITDKVAVNLKMKDGLSLANNMEAGYGHKERYYLNHTGIFITKKLKAYTQLNYNNLGRSTYLNHFNPMGHLGMLGVTGSTSENKTSTFLGTSSISSLAKAQQSDRNNALFGSINLVPHLSKTARMRINLNYFGDRSLQESSFKTIITADPDNPIVIEQSDRKRYKPRYFNADVSFTNYWGKNSLENDTQFTRLRNSNLQNGLTNGLAQELNSRSKEFYLYNSTRFTHRFNDRNVLKLETTFAFDETPEKLYVMPGINFDTNQQDQNVDNFQDINSKKESARLKGFFYHKINRKSKINLDFGLKYFNNQLQSVLEENGNDSQYVNNVDYKILLPHLGINYRWNNEHFTFSPTLRLSLYDYNHDDKNNNTESSDTKLLLNGGLDLRYKLNRYHELQVGYNHSEKRPDDKNLFTNFIMSTNRSLTNNQLSFDVISSDNYTFRYSYNNMLKDFSARIGVRYTEYDKAVQSNHQISQDVGYQTYFMSDKGGNSRSINASTRKFVDFLNSTLSLSAGINETEYYNSVNSTELRKNQRKDKNIGFNWETNFIGDFIFSEGISYAKSTYSSEGGLSNSNESVNNRFSVIYKPNVQFIARVDYNYSIPALNNKSNYFETLDATLQWNNKKKSMSYKLEGRNLMNQKDQDYISNSDYAQTTSMQSMQERYFLFSVGFRF